MKKFQHFLIEQEIGTLPEIYLDMDGVLVDFEGATAQILDKHGIEPFSGHGSGSTSVKTTGDAERWNVLYQDPQFWENLPELPEGMRLWKFVRKYKPHILSASPSTGKNRSIRGKNLWIKEHLGVRFLNTINIVNRSEKQDFAINKETGKPNILIDDFLKNILEFRAAGGIGIHHKGDADMTIAQLRKLGFK